MKNNYDFESVQQKAPMTGKVYSRQGRMTSTRRAGDTFRDTKQNFLTTSEKIFLAQNKLKENKKKQPSDPVLKVKKLEEEIDECINESNILGYENDLIGSLNKAKESLVKLKQLQKFIESAGYKEFNADLYFSVIMNIANKYEKNGLFHEAISEYKKLLNAKSSETSFLVRVNIGNIFFKQEQFSQAIKMYKMSLDMAPSKFGAIKFKIMKNIGHAYVKKNEFQEAIQAYEDVMNKYPDFETAFNLMLCLYTIGDKQKMKPTFVEMLNIQTHWNLEEDQNDEEKGLKEDPLISEMLIRKNKTIKYITDTAKLIAPIIEDDILAGYEWLIETLKNSKYSDIQSEIEIARAIYYVKSKNIDLAIESLKSFEKKDKKMMTLASTNLSFLYLLEGDIENAEKYSDIALKYDRFNSKAKVNKGNCQFYRNNFLRAKECYLEAIGIEADCVEALYNLAYVNKKINHLTEALTALEKLRTILSNSPELLYQMANIYELATDYKSALKWYDLLVNIVPNEPNIHQKIGMLYSCQNDEPQAFYHYLESFKLLPTNLDTIAWLGIYYVKNINYDKACFFFERASLLQPKDIKWKLMIASCNRRMENYEKALKLYEQIHVFDGDNLESLRFIVQINQELGRPCNQYQIKLRKLERELESLEGGFVNFENEKLDNAQTLQNQNEQQQDIQIQTPSKKPQNDIDFENYDIDLPEQIILIIYLKNISNFQIKFQNQNNQKNVSCRIRTCAGQAQLISSQSPQPLGQTDI